MKCNICDLAPFGQSPAPHQCAAAGGAVVGTKVSQGYMGIATPAPLTHAGLRVEEDQEDLPAIVDATDELRRTRLSLGSDDDTIGPERDTARCIENGGVITCNGHGISTAPFLPARANMRLSTAIGDESIVFQL